MEILRIGNVEIKKTAALAPMASVADYAYRQMAKEFGAAYVVGEMVSSKGLCYNDKKSAELLRVRDSERPMAAQLFGSEPEFMARAAVMAAEYRPDIIDINAGCPVHKVIGTGAGAALMRTPDLLYEIVSAVVAVTDIPITVKIRTGWDEDNVNAVTVAKLAEKAGAKAVTVHGRTKQQLYSGKANWEIIRQVKESVDIPVIGNGDVQSVEDCINMYEQTGCDLVMIGRASYGNLWLFREIAEYFENGKILHINPDLDQRLSVMRRHIEMIVADKGEFIGMKEARKIAGWYLKGLRGAAKFRNDCGKLSTIHDLEQLMESVRNENYGGYSD